MKKALILGANPETVSLVLKAKEMGVYTIVTDNNPRAYAKKFADLAVNIDAADVDRLERFAIEERVDGVLVGVAEALLPSYCELCKRLNKPCYSSLEKFKIMANKELFKECCKEYCVPTVDEFQMGDEISYPVIVKPVDSCSSKGISICFNETELYEGISFALGFSKSKKYLIEKYMTGEEVISYYVIQDGNPVFAGMCDRYTYKQKDKVQLPTAYIFPSKHIRSYIKNTDGKIKEMIKGIGLEHGSVFFQGFVDECGAVRVYEPGHRLNGAQEHIIFSRVSGVDAKELYINFALSGQESEHNLEQLSNPIHNDLCCKLSPLVKVGKIAHISGLKEIAALKNVVSVNPSYNVGDTVEGIGTLKQIVARFYIVSNNKKELIDTIEEIYSLFSVKDDEGREMLIGRFDTAIIGANY